MTESNDIVELIEQYENYCDKYMKNIPYPHEPLLMVDIDQVKRAIKQVKHLSWQIYNDKKRMHKSNSRKGLYVKKIEVDINIHVGRIDYRLETTPISRMYKVEISEKINKIKGYNNGHPEKCYLYKLEKELLRDNTPKCAFGVGN